MVEEEDDDEGSEL